MGTISYMSRPNSTFPPTRFEGRREKQGVIGLKEIEVHPVLHFSELLDDGEVEVTDIYMGEDGEVYMDLTASPSTWQKSEPQS